MEWLARTKNLKTAKPKVLHVPGAGEPFTAGASPVILEFRVNLRSLQDNRSRRVIPFRLPGLKVQTLALEVEPGRAFVAEDIPVALEPDSLQVNRTSQGT
jgi:hypothetical protein